MIPSMLSQDYHHYLAISFVPLSTEYGPPENEQVPTSNIVVSVYVESQLKLIQMDL
jgi:hypothetical protein